MAKFSKALLHLSALGIGAMMISGVAMAHDTSTLNSQHLKIESSTQQFKDMQAHIDELKKFGLNSNIEVKMSMHNYEEPKGDELTNASAASLNQDGSCKIDVVVLKKGKDVLYMASPDNKKVLESGLNLNSQDAKFTTLMTADHEAVHCHYSTMKSPFIVEGNKKAQDLINYTFRHTFDVLYTDPKTGETKHEAGLDRHLSESFSDSAAAVSLLKREGASPEAQSFLKKYEFIRQETSLPSKGIADVHDAYDIHYVIDSVTSKKGIAKVLNLKDDQVLDFSMKNANKSVFTSIANKNTSELFNQSYWEQTVKRAVLDINDNLEKNMNPDTFLVKAMHRVKGDLSESNQEKLKGFLQAKTDGTLTKEKMKEFTGLLPAVAISSMKIVRESMPELEEANKVLAKVSSQYKNEQVTSMKNTESTLKSFAQGAESTTEFKIISTQDIMKLRSENSVVAQTSDNSKKVKM